MSTNVKVGFSSVKEKTLGLRKEVDQIEFTVNAEDTNVIKVDCQFKDFQGSLVKTRKLVKAVLVDSIVAKTIGDPIVVVTDDATLNVTSTTGTQLTATITADDDCIVDAVSKNDGTISFDVGNAVGADYYKLLVMIGEHVFISPIIAFAA